MYFLVGREREGGREGGAAGICVLLLHPTVAAVEDQAARAAAEGRSQRIRGGRLRRRHAANANGSAGPALRAAALVHSLEDFVALHATNKKVYETEKTAVVVPECYRA